MNKKTKVFSWFALLTLTLTVSVISFANQDQSQTAENNDNVFKTAIFAGGCFWCTESDFEKKIGVIKAESGYTGGHTKKPTYKQVTRDNTGHFEAVRVTYDANKISYTELVEYYWRTIDPTDAKGQFCDKGNSYRSAIFYNSDNEKQIIETSLKQLQQNKPFAGSIATKTLPAAHFYLAEKYHQDYYKKNPIRYNFYRRSCGRDKRLKQLWGKKIN